MLANVFVDNVDKHPEDFRELIKVIAKFEVLGYIEALERVLIVLTKTKNLEEAKEQISMLKEIAYEKLNIILKDST